MLVEIRFQISLGQSLRAQFPLTRAVLRRQHARATHETVPVRERPHPQVIEAAGDGVAQLVERERVCHVARGQGLDLLGRVQRKGDAAKETKNGIKEKKQIMRQIKGAQHWTNCICASSKKSRVTGDQQEKERGGGKMGLGLCRYFISSLAFLSFFLSFFLSRHVSLLFPFLFCLPVWCILYRIAFVVFRPLTTKVRSHY
jgi:hypothetical protein